MTTSSFSTVISPNWRALPWRSDQRLAVRLVSMPQVFMRSCPFSFLDNRRKIRSVRVDHLFGQVFVVREA